MNRARPVTLIVSAALLAFSDDSSAQAPHHQHYERTDAARQPGPGGVLAPRLQKLGTHTFKVTTKSSRAQQFINQGINLTYGFNHAEAEPRVCGGGSSRPVVRHGVLGPGAGARAEHQRGDGGGRRAEGAGAGAEGGIAQRAA